METIQMEVIEYVLLIIIFTTVGLIYGYDFGKQDGYLEGFDTCKSILLGESENVGYKN